MKNMLLLLPTFPKAQIVFGWYISVILSFSTQLRGKIISVAFGVRGEKGEKKTK